MDQTLNDNLEEVIQSSVQGDPDSFRELFEILEKPLFGYVSARTNSREDAKDILQDVFVDLWRALPKFSYSSDKAFYGFVYKITKRKLSRHYHVQKKTVEFSEEHISEQYEFGGEDTILLLSAVRKLKPKYREVMELRYWSGLAFADIAKLMGARETTVKVRHHRAVKQLSQLLGDDYGK